MSETILAVRDLSKRFGPLFAVNDVTLEVARGEKLGIIGPNGSGKTTLINCITGVLRPDRGAVVFDGKDVSSTDAFREALGETGERALSVKRGTETLALKLRR